MASPSLVQVAVGMIHRPKDGAVLLASRPPGKVYAGWWEFSGGKLEPQETIGEALRRELQEELGIRVQEASPAWETEHRYDHARAARGAAALLGQALRAISLPAATCHHSCFGAAGP
jgi:mutator protein MutT